MIWISIFSLNDFYRVWNDIFFLEKNKSSLNFGSKSKTSCSFNLKINTWTLILSKSIILFGFLIPMDEKCYTCISIYEIYGRIWALSICKYEITRNKMQITSVIVWAKFSKLTSCVYKFISSNYSSNRLILNPQIQTQPWVILHLKQGEKRGRGDWDPLKPISQYTPIQARPY